MKREAKILSVTLKTPGAMSRVLSAEGESGWVVRGAASSFLFLERSDESPKENRLCSITLRSGWGILRKIEEERNDGWELGALGTTFAFFSGRTDGKSDGAPTDYRIQSITLRTPGSVLGLTNDLGEDGWELRGLSPSLAVFGKNASSKKVEHDLVSITLKTPHGIRSVVDERLADGWALADASRSFVAFSRRA